MPNSCPICGREVGPAGGKCAACSPPIPASSTPSAGRRILGVIGVIFGVIVIVVIKLAIRGAFR